MPLNWISCVQNEWFAQLIAAGTILIETTTARWFFYLNRLQKGREDENSGLQFWAPSRPPHRKPNFHTTNQVHFICYPAGDNTSFGSITSLNLRVVHEHTFNTLFITNESAVKVLLFVFLTLSYNLAFAKTATPKIQESEDTAWEQLRAFRTIELENYLKVNAKAAEVFISGDNGGDQMPMIFFRVFQDLFPQICGELGEKVLLGGSTTAKQFYRQCCRP